MADPLRDCIALMEALIEYRQKPISNQLQPIRHKYSMLHLDVLTLIYYFAASAEGNVLEIGPYLGGSTIAAALGIRTSATNRTFVSVEPGGQHQHHRLPSRDILRDLKKNLAKQRVAELVDVIGGYSWDPTVVSAVHEQIPARSVGLLMIDADGDAQRDLLLYRDLLLPGCNVVIDDYFGLKTGGKDAVTRPQIDALAASGELQTLGVYGWGTWVGRWWGEAASRST